jgi:hypothetical protein
MVDDDSEGLVRQDDQPMSPNIRHRARWLSAGIAGALAASLIAAAFAISRDPAIESVFRLRFVLASDYVGAGPLDRLFLWSSGPIAAGVSGWWFYPRAAAGKRWAGAWMGFFTYVIAIVIAAVGIAALSPSVWTDPVEFIKAFGAGAPFMAMIGMIVFVPLLIVCFAAGTAWSWAVRAVLSAPADRVSAPVAVETDPLALPPAVLIGVVHVAILLWLMVTLALGSFTDVGGAGVD